MKCVYQNASVVEYVILSGGFDWDKCEKECLCNTDELWITRESCQNIFTIADLLNILFWNVSKLVNILLFFLSNKVAVLQRKKLYYRF